MEHFTADSLGPLHEHEHAAETKELLEHRPSEMAFIEAADTFGQLCDSTRLKILWLLAHSEECVSNIAVFIDMSAPAVSHHLRLLKTSGLIVSRREGKEMLYRSADTALVDELHRIIERIAEISCPE